MRWKSNSELVVSFQVSLFKQHAHRLLDIYQCGVYVELFLLCKFFVFLFPLLFHCITSWKKQENSLAGCRNKCKQLNRGRVSNLVVDIKDSPPDLNHRHRRIDATGYSTQVFSTTIDQKSKVKPGHSIECYGKGQSTTDLIKYLVR